MPVTYEVDIDRINRVFEAQKANAPKVGLTTYKERLRKLSAISDAVLKYQQEFRDALYADYKKPAAEVDLTEIFVITSEVKHAKANLRKWMRKQKVGTPMALLGSSSWIHYEPKGVCLIIGPWNYPMQLTFGPMISAIAAGNTVMLKPSEYTPHCNAVMRKIVDELFDENEVAMFEGDVPVSTALLKLPFNHIFFTGSPQVGKIVMAAAAKHLASVTLELGGKSPTIIDETANIKGSIKRLVWSKFSNNGQICIAPDYVLVHENKKEELISEIKKTLKTFYGDDAQSSDNYMRIINTNNFKRVRSYLDNTIKEGGRVVIGGKMDEAENFIEPTVIMDAPLDSDLMQKEIFGPLLPIVTYKNIDDALAIINEKEKPLALYIYSSNNKNVDYIIKNTRAGGTCINNSAVHFFNNNLPFGGSNNSGVGKSHGFFGFQAFSNARGVLKQNLPPALEQLMPPYTNLKLKLINQTIKWF